MSSWRPARTPDERLDRTLASMVPGSLRGGLASASPVARRDRQQEPIPPEAIDEIDTGSVAFAQDLLVCGGPGNQTIALTYEPLPYSERVYWNGVYQPESVWSRTGRVLVASDGDQRINAGDEILVEYAHTAAATGRQPSKWAVLAMAKGATVVMDLDDTAAPFENWAAAVEGTPFGTVTPGRPGLFPRSPGSIRTSATPSSGIVTGVATTPLTDLSVEMRVRTTSAGPRLYLAGNRASGTGWKVGMGAPPVGSGSNGQIHFGVDGNGIWLGVITTQTFHDGQPHHVVCTYAHPGGPGAIVQSGMKIYVDGMLRSTTNSTYNGASAPLTNTGQWQVAAMNNSGELGVPGDYEGFAVYPNIVLSQADVTALRGEFL